MFVLGPAVEVSPTRYSETPASPEIQRASEDHSANKTGTDFFLLSGQGLRQGPKANEAWTIGQRSIRELLVPESQVGFSRDVAFWEGKGEDIPTSYLAHAYTLAQLESVVGTLIDGAIEKGTASGVAQIVGREFDGVGDSTSSGIDAKLDVVIQADLSKSGDELGRPLLFEPFMGLETKSASVSLQVKGLGRVNYDHSEIAHPHELDVVHYSGLYELTASIRADVVLYPLGYPCPGKLECDLKGQLLTIANRDASLR